METFLSKVAGRLTEEFGNDMHKVIVVFPNKRIGLFLNKALAKNNGGEPLLAPQYRTIDELFESYSDKVVADPVTTVCMTYQAYVEAGLSYTMPLDDFYGWGELMVRDFNEIDQQLVPADQLFQNAKDIEEIDTRFFPDTFDSKTESVLNQFRGTEYAKKQLKRWLELWTKMPLIYHRLNELLASARVESGFALAYKGALQREVIEQGKVVAKEGYRYVFVGFNVLTETEKALMEALKDVAMFINDDAEEDNRPEIGIIQATTDIQQAEYVHTWIEENMRNGRIREDRLTHTAVVLADEGLLLPVISSFPPIKTNITMGYPMSQTPLLSYINSLRSKFNEEMPDGMAEEYLQYVIDSLRERMREGPADRQMPYFYHLMDEALARALFETDKLLQNIRTGQLSSIQGLTLPLVQRILVRMLACHSIAFHGEPAQGLQVMGVLETRSLDFDNLLVLSANEGVLPKNERAKSMIPYVVRQHYHLADEEKKVMIYSNNFFRLFRRAKHIDIVYSMYNASGEAEESRFIRQMLALKDWDVRYSKLVPSTSVPVERDQQAFAKTGDIVEQMITKTLSPSALNTYMNCPRSYYYSQVKGLKKEEDISEDLQINQIGTLFHKAAELFYSRYGDKAITAEMLDNDKTVEIEKATKGALDELIYGKKPELETTPGFLLVVRGVLNELMLRLVEMDKKVTPFRIFSLEKEYYCDVDIDGKRLRIGGRIDRVDLLSDNKLRIVDYKAGSKEKSEKSAYSSLGELCNMDVYKQCQHYQVQLLFYSYVLQRIYPDKQVEPALCFPLSSREQGYYPRVRYVGKDGKLADIGTYEVVREDFEAQFESLLRDEIYKEGRSFVSPWDKEREREESFYEKADSTRCRYCDFRSLCGIGKAKEY